MRIDRRPKLAESPAQTIKAGFLNKRDTRDYPGVCFFHYHGKSPTSRSACFAIAAPLLLEERRVRSAHVFHVVRLGICGVESAEAPKHR